jgi:hypothetical protein
MISLDFDTNESASKLDVHQWESTIVLVAHNGFSYTRILIPQSEIKELINKLNKYNDEAESVQ